MLRRVSRWIRTSESPLWLRSTSPIWRIVASVARCSGRATHTGPEEPSTLSSGTVSSCAEMVIEPSSRRCMRPLITQIRSSASTPAIGAYALPKNMTSIEPERSSSSTRA